MMQDTIFRTMHHLCIIVRDIEKSVAYYESLGIGPWASFPPLDIFTDLMVMDRQGFLNLTFRYAALGNMQLQLCQPGEGDSPQKQFLETRGEGVYHLGFTVPDVDEAEAQATALGLQPKSRGRLPNGGFTYFDTADKGAEVILEVRALNVS